MTGRRRRARTPRARAPVVLLAPALVALAFLTLPLAALIVRAPWSDLAQILTAGPVQQAMWLSLRTAATSTLLCLLVGVPLAWVLARTTFRGQGLVRALVALPMVLPPVVGGVALLSLLGRRGLAGAYLDTWFGVTIPFSTLAVVLAQAFVSLPFLVLSVDGSLRALDERTENVAATFGASRWYTFRRVTIPMIAPAIGAGGVLCSARALGEFGATITFAGNFPGTTRTMPVAIYLAMEHQPATATGMSVLLVAISALALVLLRSHWLSALRGNT